MSTHTMKEKSTRRDFIKTSGTAAVAGANLVHIPMAGDAESLNVAQAAAVLLAESGRRGILQSAPELSQL